MIVFAILGIFGGMELVRQLVGKTEPYYAVILRSGSFVGFCYCSIYYHPTCPCASFIIIKGLCANFRGWAVGFGGGFIAGNFAFPLYPKPFADLAFRGSGCSSVIWV